MQTVKTRGTSLRAVWVHFYFGCSADYFTSSSGEDIPFHSSQFGQLDHTSVSSSSSVLIFKETSFEENKTHFLIDEFIENKKVKYILLIITPFLAFESRTWLVILHDKSKYFIKGHKVRWWKLLNFVLTTFFCKISLNGFALYKRDWIGFRFNHISSGLR